MPSSCESLTQNSIVLMPFEHNFIGGKLYGVYSVGVSVGDVFVLTRNVGNIHFSLNLNNSVTRSLLARDAVSQGVVASAGLAGNQGQRFITYIQALGLNITFASGLYTISNGVLTLTTILPTTYNTLSGVLLPFAIVPQGRYLNSEFYAWIGYADVAPLLTGVIY
jgi:hypothetical protein